MVDSKERLEKLAKRADFSAKYISLPCFIVSAVLVLATVGHPMMLFNLMMAVFNGFGYWLNIKTRDRCQTVLNGVTEMERLQKIKALNPNKG